MNSIAAKMTWEDLTGRARSTGVAIIPAGSTERHGKHLPMETDSATAFEVASRVANRTGAIVFPTLHYGIIETAAFQGVFLNESTYSAVVKDICLGVESLGFKKILFISGHGPNNPYILQVLKQLFKEKHDERIFCMAHCMTLIRQLMPDFIQGRHIGHSDFRETSIMLVIDNEHVLLDRVSQPEKIASNFVGNLESAGVHLVGLEPGKISLCHDITELKDSGGYGQVEGASVELGERILNTLVDYLTHVVNELIEIRLPLSKKTSSQDLVNK